MKYWCIILVLAVVLAGCGTTGSSPAVSGLVGLDAALDGAILDIESKLPKGTPIVVTTITAPHYETSDYVGDALSSRFKNLKTLAREAALSAVMKEQDFQMSGIVSDDSAVGIGHFIGAQAVISGDVKNYADYTQLRLRVVNVESSEAFIYMARINNKDRILANLMPQPAAATRNRPTKVSDNALAHLNRGNDYLAQRMFDEALQEFDQAIAKNKRFAEAYFGRGIAFYRKRGNTDRAIAEFNQAIQINPHYAEAYFSRGFQYWDKNDYDRAIAEFTSAIQINPNYDAAYYWRGYMYNFNKDFDSAIADFTSAIRVNPNFGWAYITRGGLYVYKGEFDRAIADYNSAIRIDNNDVVAYDYRGDAYMKKGERDRAIADYNQVIRIYSSVNPPVYAGNYSRRGQIFMKIGDIDRAIADFSTGIQMDPNTAYHYNYRADAYAAKGDINRAIADYETAMRLGNTWLQSTIDRLKSKR